MKLLLAALLPLLALTACRTLDPAGPYRGDQALHAADQAIAGAYDAIDTFLYWQHTNEKALAAEPRYEQAADHLRAHAGTWLTAAVTARDTYAAARTDANRQSLDAALATLQTAVNQTAALLADHGNRRPH